jgi:hypothetical protein
VNPSRPCSEPTPCTYDPGRSDFDLSYERRKGEGYTPTRCEYLYQKNKYHDAFSTHEKNDQTHMSKRYLGSSKHFLSGGSEQKGRQGRSIKVHHIRPIVSSGPVNSSGFTIFCHLPLCTLFLLQSSERNPQRLVLLPALVPKGIDGKVYT